MRGTRISPATIALLGLAAAFGAAPAAKQREQRESDDIAERQARRAAKLARRAAAAGEPKLECIHVRPRDPVPGTKAYRKANKPHRAKRGRK